MSCPHRKIIRIFLHSSLDKFVVGLKRKQYFGISRACATSQYSERDCVIVLTHESVSACAESNIAMSNCVCLVAKMGVFLLLRQPPKFATYILLLWVDCNLKPSVVVTVLTWEVVVAVPCGTLPLMSYE